MPTAAHINDAGITLLDSTGILYREPGFALIDGDRFAIGDEAFSQARIKPRQIQHRYWSELTVDSLPDGRFAQLSAADLVSRQLEMMAAVSEDQGIILAVPSYMSSQQLGLLLGIAEGIKLPIVAMVDSAVAATRREYRGAVPVHIDMSLHSITLSRLAQPGLAQLERTEVLDDCGRFALIETWLHVIAEAFVQQSRFDPLHTAETEQILVSNMDQWLAEASRSDHVRLTVECGSVSHEATVESLTLIGAAAPVYQRIASKLRAMFRADEVPALQLTDRVARMPGLADMLKARVGGEVFALEPGATARGALARCRDNSGGNGGVSLKKQLPWDQVAADAGDEVTEKTQAGVPTHALFGSTAYAIGDAPLVLGSEQAGNDRMVLLEASMPGVSRRHCSLHHLNSQCVLEDHSRYGTFLNGHRIDGSAVLQTGDQVRVGSPGFELLLITTDEQHG